ncbi:MAG TPA: pyruvate dehydrogenase complex E1 component subunit beta [Planctomycetota bacterium]|nr:pyruvate dehydrogenase complex E1 component subunit beta [Planctomycetota bacterium]
MPWWRWRSGPARDFEVTHFMSMISIRTALNQALTEEMERDSTVFLMGEEVGEYNGAYKVSQGMLAKFGQKRIIDTPISECGFAGVGIGAAMVGLRPIIEMMTFNFALQAIDQIVSNAAKMYLMSGGQYGVPIVFRGPNGAAHMLASQHSQSFESFYSQVPGLKVVTYSDAKDAKGLLKTAIRDNDPVIFLESEMTYGELGEVPEGEYLIPLGKGEVKRPGTDVTIIAWSKMVPRVALKVAEELSKQGIEAEVIDPRTLKPLDEEMIFESVRKTNRAVIIEEDFKYCGLGAEIAERIYNACFDDLDAPIERVTSLDVPMPYAHSLESAVLPSVERGLAAARKVLYI